MNDLRGTYEDGYKYARQGGKPSELRDDKGNIIGYRQGVWLNGFRQAQIDMRAELRAKGIIPMTDRKRRFKLVTKWD